MKYSAIFIFLMVLVFSSTATAVPNYARNLGMECSGCHTVFPLLNATGKQFKETSVPLNQNASGMSSDVLGARIKFRPIDKRTSKNRKGELRPQDKQFKTRGLHEVEVFLAGKAGNVSYFVELEGEDEWGDAAKGFQFNVVAGHVSYSINPYINLYTGLGSPFLTDGNNTVNRHKPIRRAWAVSSKGFVPGASQVIGLSGRIGNTFYSTALHADEKDNLEGKDPASMAFRLAHDFGSNVTIGGFYDRVASYDKDAGISTHVGDRYGLDVSLNSENAGLAAIYGIKDSDTEEDYGVSTEMYYMFKKNGKAWITPVLQLNQYTENNSVDKTTDGSLYLQYNINNTVRLSTGVEKTFSKPDRYLHKEVRFVTSIEVTL